MTGANILTNVYRIGESNKYNAKFLYYWYNNSGDSYFVKLLDKNYNVVYEDFTKDLKSFTGCILDVIDLDNYKYRKMAKAFNVHTKYTR